MRLLNVALPIAALCLGSAPLLASPVTFFGQDINTAGGSTHTTTLTNSNAAHNTFFSNLSGTQTQTFESYAANTYLPLTVSFGSAGNATLTDTSHTAHIASGADAQGYFPISGSKFLETGTGSGFTINFSNPISAFGFYGTDVGDVGATLTLGLVGGVSTTLVVPATVGQNGSTSGSALYFGFYDLKNAYTSITFNNMGGPGSDVFGFDDFTIGSLAQVTPAATPEPSSLMLLGSGLTALYGMRRRLRRS